MQNFKINLIKSNHCLGVDFYTGTMKFKDIVDKFVVPIYKAGTRISDGEGGYQRNATDARINAVSERVSKIDQVSQPFVDNINLNIRHGSAVQYVVPLNADENNYGDFFELTYTDVLGEFYIVDGQTRVRGAAAALANAKQTNDSMLVKAIENITIQFTLSFCDDIYKEAYLFYLINQHSKKIPPEGAHTLITQGYENGVVDFLNEITDQNKKTDIYSYQVAERLNDESDIWSNEMKDFNEKNKDKKITILAVSRMIAPLLTDLAQKSEDNTEKAKDACFKIVEAYWQGLKLVFPKIFNKDTKNEYNILKAGPAEVMTLVLTGIVRKNDKSKLNLKLTSSASYKGLLYKLREFSDMNAANTTVKGAAIFWVGKGGALGKYSNNAGKKDIARRMIQHIFPDEKSVI